MRTITCIFLVIALFSVVVAAAERSLVVVYTNDVHGGILYRDATFLNPDFPPRMGSYAEAYSYIAYWRDYAKKNGYGFLLVDAGDWFTGDPIGTLSKGEAVIPRGDATTNIMGHIVCDAMRETADADFAISNMGGVRSDIAAGEITYRDVFNVLPFGNAVVAYNVSGKVLKDVVAQVAGRHHGLLISGGTVIYSRSRHSANPIVKMTIGGKPVKNDAQYWLALSDYLVDAYGLAELQKLPDADVCHTYTTIRDALAKYISEHSPIVPKADGRWETIK